MKTRKLLLTSSQVSIVLTSVIICCFTAIIFLVGVFVQQQSVKSLHAALKPRAVPREVLNARLSAYQEEIRTTSDGSWWTAITRYAGRSQKQKPPISAHPFEWNRHAYAQVLRKPTDVCNALIIFAELQRGKSPIPRLLLFPQHWMLSKEGQDEGIDSAKRLLKKASRRYKAILVPFSSSANDTSDLAGTSTLFALTDYDIVAVSPVPGVVVRAEKMDELLVGRVYERPVTKLIAGDGSKQDAAILVIRPSIESWRNFNSSAMAGATEIYTSSVFDTSTDDIDEAMPIITTSSTLRTASGFNATRFNHEAAYVHLVDDGFPSPEYDLPYEEIVKARPKNAEQAFIWEKTESTYKDLRYRVCGLDPIEWNRGPSVFDRIEEPQDQFREDL